MRSDKTAYLQNPSCKERCCSPLWDFVDQVICICLTHRADRFKETCDEIHRIGLCSKTLFLRVTAPTEAEFEEGKRDINKKNIGKGIYGCWRSHQTAHSVGRDFFKSKASRTLILEDDVKFVNIENLQNVRDVARRMQADETKWDIFLLGHCPLFGIPSVQIPGMFHTWSTLAHAYIVTEECRDCIIDTQFKHVVENAVLGPGIDNWFLRKMRLMAPFPMIAVQRGCPNDNQATKITEYFKANHETYARPFEILAFVLLPLAALVILMSLLIYMFKRRK